MSRILKIEIDLGRCEEYRSPFVPFVMDAAGAALDMVDKFGVLNDQRHYTETLLGQIHGNENVVFGRVWVEAKP